MKLKQVLLWFVLLPLVSGLLLWISWPPSAFTFPVFLGLVPLFIADRKISSTYKRFTGFKAWLAIYTGLLIWNLLTTWWVSIASVGGGLFANFANPALMSVPFMLARNVRKQFGEKLGMLAFIVFWMSFESIHLRWELTWPWLSLGNVFAANHTWIQWYEYTGAFGGTLWVLLTNTIILNLLLPIIYPVAYPPLKQHVIFKHGITFVAIIVIPILISKIIYAGYTEKGVTTNVTVLQPNYDPYTEKFLVPYKEQMKKMLGLSFQKINDSTDFLVWPETAIQDEVWIDKLKYQKPVRDLKKAIDSFPNLTVVVGVNGFEEYPDKASSTATSRTFTLYSEGRVMYYDIYNTAIALNNKGPMGYYHKSKLVPGAERMPYPEFFAFMGDWAIKLGGISGTLGIQKERTVFFNEAGIGVAPVICYESVFGEYVGDYVKKGAGLIFIITNDGWWGNTDGHKQHCLYAKLRSIETRRATARSANTGTSCFINQRGDISQATAWSVDAVINADLHVNNTLTFYTKHGDYLARFAFIISAGLLLGLVYKKIINKSKQIK
jgi:apolipoprotein N-acyltransferase